MQRRLGRPGSGSGRARTGGDLSGDVRADGNPDACRRTRARNDEHARTGSCADDHHHTRADGVAHRDANHQPDPACPDSHPLASADRRSDRHPHSCALAHGRSEARRHVGAGTHRHPGAHARAERSAQPRLRPRRLPPPRAVATVTGLVSREDLGIREVDTAEALAAAGLRYVRCAAGEVVPQQVGLYLLDVETGEIEGWALASLETANPDGFISADVSLSPGNRFVTFDRFQYDRETGLTFEWDAPPLQRWGTQDDEWRLLFRMPDEAGDRFVVTDGTLQPVAQFTLPDRQEGVLQWLNLNHRSLVVRGQQRDGGSHRYLHFFDLADEIVGAFEPSATQVLPGRAKTWSEGQYRLSHLGSSIELAVADPGSCHVMHYGWDGTTLLAVSVPVSPQYGPRDCRISPDGRWLTAVTATAATGTSWGAPIGMAVSLLDTTTGNEVYRVKGVDGPGRWLDDSSGISMSTSRGTRIVTLDGQWAEEAPRPAPARARPTFVHVAPLLAIADGSLAGVIPALVIPEPPPVQKPPDYRITDKGRKVTARDHEGNMLASLAFAEPGSDDGYYFGYPSFFASWGATRDEVRVRVSIYPPGRCGCGGDHKGEPPLAPVIESPPFENHLQVEVVVDTCLRLREEPSLSATVVDCLPNGYILDTDDYALDYYNAHPFMRVRTADGREGWASADYLRWVSDGVELEGERMHYYFGV